MRWRRPCGSSPHGSTVRFPRCRCRLGPARGGGGRGAPPGPTYTPNPPTPPGPTTPHRYVLDEAGLITDAQIVPPTSQNQASVEADLRAAAQEWVDLDDHELTHRCEQAIRNYDPCISCATHFLDLRVSRL